MLFVGHYYENREQVITGTTATTLPQAATDLLAAFRWGQEVQI